MKTAVLFVDGASRGNPGLASIGVSLCDSEHNERKNLSRAIGKATNNEAEYRALIEGLSLALNEGVSDLKVYSDSELLVRQIQGQYKVKVPHLKVLFSEATSLISKFQKFSLSHIPREKNERADQLANEALDAPGH